MKKQLVGYMVIGLLTMAMVVQGQTQTRPRQNARPSDSTVRMIPMQRMGSMNGARMEAVRPGQVGVQGRMQRRGAVAAPGNNRMQRGGAVAAPGNNRMQRGRAIAAPGGRGMQRGGMAQGFGGSRNMQQGMQQGMRRGMQPGMQQGMRRGMQPGMQQGSLVNPEVRIKAEVDKLKTALNLTDDQVKKITSIKKKQAKKEIARYKKAQKKTAARQKKVQVPSDKIKSVLTDEQVKLYESSRSAVRIMR